MMPKKKVTVAIIGYGIDTAHRDIKHPLWINPEENVNGKDDDGDGRIDDIHGWNFFGNDSVTVNNLSREGDREFLRLKDNWALKAGYPDEQQTTGDNPYDLGDTHYGNSNLQADNAGYGTMQADIIAATAGNAGQVEIMALRVDVGDYGESYAKDVALAIRYTVDKGADIIQIGKTNTLIPAPTRNGLRSAAICRAKRNIRCYPHDGLFL